MDLLAELRRKVSEIDPHDNVDGIKAAIRHIERAESFLDRARSEQDPDLFNDVIYRTNQAFEGMLKEAYSVLEDADPSRLSANDIEQHFVTEKRLTERVHGLFKNYRQQWRNPATHDHKLLFSEEEALLAIVNVSAFAVLLLDQIIETISFKRQRAATAKKAHVAAAFIDSLDKPLVEQVVTFIRYFLENEAATAQNWRSEPELIGALSGFLVGSKLGLDVDPNMSIADRGIDLAIRRGGERVLIQLKFGRYKPDYVDAAITQLRRYVVAAPSTAGILLLASGASHKTVAEKISDDPNIQLWVIRGEGSSASK